MNTNFAIPSDKNYPPLLRHIPDPPQQLHTLGEGLPQLMQRPRVAVVGSRKASAYGRSVTEQLVRQLVRAGVVIVSGLAIGIDGIAHRAALDEAGSTIAVLPAGLDHVYPACHHGLAERIVQQGGLLLSEYGPGTPAYKQHFIARNRIVSGLSDGVLITEAALKSGTLHTARFALEQGREVMAVPGDITRAGSEGTNNLIRAGATPITKVADIFYALGIEPEPQDSPRPQSEQPHEQLVLDLLVGGTCDGNALLQTSGLSAAAFNQAVTMLELTGKIRTAGGNQWMLR